MTNYVELVRELRAGCNELELDAADAIEHLMEKLAKLSAENVQLVSP